MSRKCQKSARYKNHCGKNSINEKVAIEQVAEFFKKFKLPEKNLIEMKTYLKNSNYARMDYRHKEITRLQGAKTKEENRIKNLLDMRLDGDLEKETYDLKKGEFEERIKKIKTELESHDNADKQFFITIELLLDLAINAYELFKSSNLHQKRRLLQIVFSNFVLKDGSLCFSLKKPFDMMVDLDERPEWSCRE